MISPLLRQILIAAALFISSACGLIIEIVAGRLLAPYVGMSLYTWTAIIAVVLAGLSVGHWIGGLLAAPHVETRIGARRVGWALAASAVSCLAILVLLRVVASLLMPSGLAPIPVIIILSTALFFLPSLFVGIVSPILTKLALDDDKNRHSGKIIGRMYALGTLGSIAGTLVAGYVLISWLGSVDTVLLVAAVYAALAVCFLLADRFRMTALAVTVLCLGGFGLWGNQLHAFSSPCDLESDYFCIRVDAAPAFGPTARLMALDHLVHSINDRAQPDLLYSPYIHFVDEYAKYRLGNKAPAAYFIGGGGFSLPRAWAYQFGARANLVIAEIDPGVTRVAADRLWLEPHAPGLRIVHRDARAYLQSLSAEPTFDVIFGDAFHDIAIPQHLVTREFHDEIARRLNPDGFYAINAVDTGRNPLFLMSLVKTLYQSFHSVEVWAERGEINGQGRVTFLVIASNRSIEKSVLIARRGLERSWERWPEGDLKARIGTAGVILLSDDFAPVDRLMSDLLLSPEH
ncbi:MAG: fused MFS/spermidine synthase [Rhodospirillales bacterium]|nr:fused MFS/spermidine synthase [Rhodospirillales bacterium]